MCIVMNTLSKYILDVHPWSDSTELAEVVPIEAVILLSPVLFILLLQLCRRFDFGPSVARPSI